MAEKVTAQVVANNGEIVTSMVSRRKARILVEEGRAEYKDENTIFIPLNSEKFKVFIRERDNYTCYYCGETGASTIDHKIPEAKGGCSTPVNCVCACQKCNGEKGKMTERQYRKFLAEKEEN